MRILSGVQPSGKLHLGNYFGAIKQHIALQEIPNAERFYDLAVALEIPGDESGEFLPCHTF